MMNERLGTPVLVVLLAALAWPGGRALAEPREHPDFTTGVNRPQRILVLPPTARIVRGKVNDAEPMIKETEALERNLAEHLARRLERLGYQAETPSPQDIASDRQLAAVVDRVETRVAEVLAQAFTNPRDVRAGRYTIEDAAVPLAVLTQAEGLLVVQSQSIIHSKGRKVMAGVLGAVFGNPLSLIGTRTRTQAVGALFDMRDGQLLALLAGAEAGAVLKDPEGVAAGAAESVLSDFPARGETDDVWRKWRERAGPRDVPDLEELRTEGDSAESVLAEFERVAGDSPPTGPILADDPEADRTRPDGAGPEAEPDAGAAAGEPEAEREGPTEVATRTGDFVADGPRDAASDAAATAASASEATRSDADVRRALHDTPPAERPEPSLQVVFVSDAGPTSVVVRNMSPGAVRASLDLRAWVRLEPGEERSFGVEPGSHRLLVAEATRDVELARAAMVVSPGRRIVAEAWPR